MIRSSKLSLGGVLFLLLQGQLAPPPSYKEGPGVPSPQYSAPNDIQSTRIGPTSKNSAQTLPHGQPLPQCDVIRVLSGAWGHFLGRGGPDLSPEG